ncbi:MAG: CBS domain-containing protein [Phycisphaerales bacterium]
MSDRKFEKQSQDFLRIMDILEEGITVEMIMTEPAHCVDPDKPVSSVLEDPELSGFDCFPVRAQAENGNLSIIGAVFRSDDRQPNLPAKEAMRPLHQVPLVGSRDSVDRLIRLMHERKEYYFLVLHESRVSGIVTRSDLDRLPVRLLLISRIVHAEQIMTMILNRCAETRSDWFAQLSGGRQKAVRGVQDRNRASGDDLELIECLYLCDKLTLLDRLAGLREVKQSLSSMEKLRNRLMHAREADDDDESLAKMIERAVKIDQAIELMEQHLAEQEEQET